jgi:glutathione S-transferase
MHDEIGATVLFRAPVGVSMKTETEPLVLYELSGCPYCRRVRRTLDRMDLAYETHQVPPSHADRTAVERVSGQTGVPVFTDPNTDVEGMAESGDIIEYLEDTYEYPEGVEPRQGLFARLRSYLA